MNQLTLKGASLMLFMSVALAPVVSFAAIDVSAGSDASVDSGTDVNATLSDSIIEIEVGVGATSTASSTEEEVEANTDASFRLNASGVAILSASEVRSEADLEVYAENLAASEERVDEVVVDQDAEGDTRVLVHYEHDGKLFGVMPVTVTSTTKVTFLANGEIKAESDLPWWSFMVTGVNHASNEIESRVLDNPTVMASAEAELSASTKAHVAEAIVAELKAHSALQANLNAE